MILASRKPWPSRATASTSPHLIRRKKCSAARWRGLRRWSRRPGFSLSNSNVVRGPASVFRSAGATAPAEPLPKPAYSTQAARPAVGAVESEAKEPQPHTAARVDPKCSTGFLHPDQSTCPDDRSDRMLPRAEVAAALGHHDFKLSE
jgi:hypothetical protein